MSAKEIRVECPCCESYLELDVRTGKLVRWRKKAELDEAGKPVLREEDWEAVNERVAGRLDTAVDKFDASLAKEKRRGDDLDELFRKASEKVNRPDSED